LNSDYALGTVRQRGEQVSRMLNGYASRVNEVASGARSRLEASLLEFNSLTSELGQLNRQIVNGEVSGRISSDLRDQRDRVLDTLSELANVQVVERGNGSVGVFLSGNMLVDGSSV